MAEILTKPLIMYSKQSTLQVVAAAVLVATAAPALLQTVTAATVKNGEP